MGDNCKHSMSAACLPAGSWETFEMHGLVETHGCLNAVILAGSVFWADFL